MSDYEKFIASKSIISKPVGITNHKPLNPHLFDFQRDCVSWALKRGRAALFEGCGLGKSLQELDWADKVVAETKNPCLLITPIMVAEQFMNEARKFGIESPIRICTSKEDVGDGINITNYHKLHKFDVDVFGSVVLDESSVLKHETGKYRTEIIRLFRDTPYKLEGTATPSPNDYMELGSHAEFLGIMTVTEMLATFFIHDGGETQSWRLKRHAQEEFWKWVCSWAVNLRKPSDLGYEDRDYILPPIHNKVHFVETDMKSEGFLIPMEAHTMDERRAARRASIEARAEYAAEMINANDEQWIVWAGLNNESELATKLINGSVEVTGSQSEDEQSKRIKQFITGEKRVLVSKGSICGWGLNLQFCRNMLFLGLSDSQELLHQARARIYRFGQKREVNCHIVISNLENQVLRNIKLKEADAAEMAEQMVKFMADISSKEIKGATTETEEYNPQQIVKVPNWIKSE